MSDEEMVLLETWIIDETFQTIPRLAENSSFIIIRSNNPYF